MYQNENVFRFTYFFSKFTIHSNFSKSLKTVRARVLQTLTRQRPAGDAYDDALGLHFRTREVIRRIDGSERIACREFNTCALYSYQKTLTNKGNEMHD